MSPELLNSQFAALEEPADAVTLNVAQTPAETASEIKQLLNL